MKIETRHGIILLLLSLVATGTGAADMPNVPVRGTETPVNVDGVLDACVLAVSERMLRYNTAGEFDFSDDFGWLDITHGLTYAHAGRWC